MAAKSSRSKVVSAPPGESPGKRNTAGSKLRKKASKYCCPICQDEIDDDCQDSIYCEGDCQTWVHRGCGGLSKQAFGAAKGIPMWSCHTCCLAVQSRELNQLKKDLADLHGTVSSLSSKINSLETKVQPVVPQSSISPLLL